MWDSIDGLTRLIFWANVSIACSLLLGFVGTVVVIKAGDRKDELTALEDHKRQERATTAEDALSKLQESLKDRSISGEQKAKLIAALSGKTQGRVEIWWLSGESDSYGLALQIQEVFEASGWQKPPERLAVGGIGVGLFIGVRDMSNPPAHAIVIQRAFASAGIPINGFGKPDTPADMAEIFIGQKPRVK